MKSRRIFIAILVLISFACRAFGQEAYSDSIAGNKDLKFKFTALIIPSALIGFGVIGIESDALKAWNSEIKSEINESIDERLTIDDFTQYVPIAAVYALNAFGVKGKNNFRDRTTILATSLIIMTSTVGGLKLLTEVQRPDNTTNNSFPSGHTATAFMGAEFLWQEYKDVSIWYGISGYVIAAGTGFFRMYNDRHWLTDIAAGAGIGMLSTKIAYWVNPWITKILYSKKGKDSSSMCYPFYNGEQFGMSLVMSL